VPLEYDDRNPFVVCNASFTPIYKVCASSRLRLSARVRPISVRSQPPGVRAAAPAPDATPAQGSKLERCSYCGAAYKPENKGRLCDVCNLGEAGGEATGLVCYANQLTDVD